MNLWTIYQVAERLAVSPRTVRRLIAVGDLQPVRVGRQLRFRPEEVEQFVDDSQELA